MKLRVTAGNPETEEWDEMHVIELTSYGDIFAKKNPHIPPTDAFDNQLAVEDAGVSFYATEAEPVGLARIQVTAYYTIDTHWLNLIVKHDNKPLVQVSGVASDEYTGLHTIFHIPNTGFPIEITVVMDDEPDQ